MEKKLVRVPFNLELAKQIHGGNNDGKIITRSGGSVRNIVFNLNHTVYTIAAIVENEDGFETVESYDNEGRLTTSCFNNLDLVLEVPEYMMMKPFDRVLVRQSDTDKWECSIFSYYTNNNYRCGGTEWKYCIPYNENTKKLIGTCINE